MRNWHKAAASLAALLAIAGPALAAAQAPAQAQAQAQAKKTIAEQLLYPRDARYTLPAVLPAAGGDAAKNAEWLAVARALGKAGLVRLTQEGAATRIDGLERSLDVVVPSMNLRYETTAINVVLGRWDIDVARFESRADGGVAHGKRRLAARTRAYAPLVEALPAAEVARFSDRDASWEIRSKNGVADVQETLH